MHRLQDLVRLHREGVGARKIAQLLGMSPNTERKYRQALDRESLLVGDPKDLPSLSELKAIVLGVHPLPTTQTSSIENYLELVTKKREAGAQPRAIYDFLRTDYPEFSGSLSAIKRMCLRIDRAAGVSPDDVKIPVITTPGDVAQVDFGSIGKLYDPETERMRKAYVFVMVLGHSRLMYADIVFDQKVPTWVGLHVRAFAALGGVPQTVVPDNLKAAVTKCYFTNAQVPELNRSYRELARHYGFRVDPTPPYSPHLKGKVESGVKYVKRNFFKPRTFTDVDDARGQLSNWLDVVANARIHGTTYRVPQVVFETEERDALLPLPEQRYDVVIWKQAKVHPDCHVVFEKRQYSVPYRTIGQSVWVRAQGNSVTIYDDNERIATHERAGERRKTNRSHFPEHRYEYSHRDEVYWRKRAHEISPIVGAFIESVFESDEVVSQLRTVQSLVTFLSTYPVSRADAACERAELFGNYTYVGVKRILVNGLDFEPVNTGEYSVGKLDNPRFARLPETEVH